MSGSRRRLLSFRPRIPLLLLLLAAVFYGGVLYQTAMRDPSFSPVLRSQDMFAYDQWARAMAEGDFAYDPRPDLPLDPAYPLLLAGLYRLMGPEPVVAAAAQLLALLTAVAATFSLTRRLFSPRVALLAAGLLAGYGPLIFYATRLLRAAWVVAAVVAGACALVLALQRRSRGWSLAAGLAFGFAAGLRPNNLLLLAVAAGALLRTDRRADRASYARTIAFLVGLALGWGPWVAFRLLHPPASGAASPGLVGLLAANTPDAAGVYYYVPPMARHIWDTHQLALWPTLEALARVVAAQPLDFLGVQVRKVGLFWNGYEPMNNVSWRGTRELVPLLRFSFPGFWPLGALGVAGWCAAWKRSPEHRVLAALALAQCASVVPFMVLSRYRLPILPLLTPFAAAFCVSAWERVRARRLKGRVLGVIGVAALLMATHPRMTRVLIPAPIFTYFEQQERATLAGAFAAAGQPEEALRRYAALRAAGPPFGPAAVEEVGLWLLLGRPVEAARVCRECAAAGLHSAELDALCASL